MVAGLLLVAVLVGACQLEFLCDDAYIAFRYVSNAHDGHGLVWNRAPFEPVEGYTSYLWVVILWATWSWLGIAPPVAANWLSMGCGVLLMVSVFAFVWRRMRSPERWPAGATLLALLLLASNRTFLQWLTSGLETALFNLLFAVWVLLGCRSPKRQDTAWLWQWSLVAALSSLARPDGLLFACASVTLGVWDLCRRQRSWRSVLIGLSPLLLTVSHLVWRFATYGEWLPNTYYAKVVEAWPEAGLRYLAAFSVENGLWLWAALCAAWLINRLYVLRADAFAAIFRHLPKTAVISATVVHVGNYILIVGGDHFEYRVLSHLMPLLAVSSVAMTVTLTHRSWLRVGTLLLLLLFGSVGWAHLAWTWQNPPAVPFPQQIAHKAPAWARPLTNWFDRNQAWLQYQYIGVRCPQHAVTLDKLRLLLPERKRMEVNERDLPLLKTPAAGIPGWTMPDCAVLDLLGLNDWVGARTPPTNPPLPYLTAEQMRTAIAACDLDRDNTLVADELRELFRVIYQTNGKATEDMLKLWRLLFDGDEDGALTSEDLVATSEFFAGLRFMAHQRHVPKQYVKDLDPNVTFDQRVPIVRAREVPLTPERLRTLEQEWRHKVRSRKQ